MVLQIEHADCRPTDLCDRCRAHLGLPSRAQDIQCTCPRCTAERALKEAPPCPND